MKRAFFKWFFATWVLGVSLSQAPAQSGLPSVSERAIDIQRPSQGSPDIFMRFSPEQSLKANSWKKTIIDDLVAQNQDDCYRDYSFRLISQHTDKRDELHARFQLRIAEVPVKGIQWIVHQRGSDVYAIQGSIPGCIPHINTSEKIAETAARDIAIAQSPARCYAWDEAPQQHPFPEAKLVLLHVEPERKYVLCWQVDVYRTKPLSREWVFVNAENGKIEARWNRLHSVDVPAQANTLYDGQQNITTDSISPGRFRLQAANRGQGIFTYDLRQGTNFAQAFDIENSTKVWDAPTDPGKAGWSAHYAAEKSYDYFSQVWNRNSYDNAGAPLISYVGFDQNLGNAFWNGQAMIFGDGDGQNSNPFVSPDIVAHEFVHGITDNTAQLLYSGESGALNEMFSDVFGVLAESWIRQQPVEWVIGAELRRQGGIRSLEDPNRFNHPDTYQGVFWFAGAADNGGVHTNCSVGNHWFYLLSQGGQGVNDLGNHFQVQAIGADDAAEIAFRTLTVYLTPSSNFANARFFSIQAAEDLHGACSPEARAVAEAWQAVGVGGAYGGNVQANFIIQPISACDTPATIQFDNQSQNAQTYRWNFGDGNTSTSTDPSHTYRQAGTYTVQLIANGTGTCNTADTLSQTLVVQADSATSSSPCSPATTQSNPSRGIFQIRLHTLAHTSIGSPEGYQDFSCSNRVRLEQGKAYPFEISTGVDTPEYVTVWVDWNANGDFADVKERIYEGRALQYHRDSIFVPAAAAGNQPLRMRIRSEALGPITGPCQAAQQGQVEDYGIIVLPRTVLPQAAFRADRRLAGVGEPIRLEDRSLGAPSSWQWTLPGATATSNVLDTISAMYNAPGKYDVTLKVDNAQGNDSLVAVDYLDILPVFLLGNAVQASDTAGFVYDDGGFDGDYSNGSNFSITIAPPCARWVELHFTQFDIEQCCDMLTVYDGDDATAPVLLVATGNTLPPSIRGNSGKLTIVLTAGPNGNAAGFGAYWRAEAPPANPPIAAFTFSPSSLPFNSSIQFTDGSSGDPRDWFWDFGDGTRDTGFSVSHSFITSGPATVQLIVDNCTGRDTISQNITIQTAPQFAMRPDTLFATLNDCNDTIVQFVTLYNRGAGDLVIRGTELPKDPSQLDSVRSRFNRRFPELNSLIPSRYDFTGGTFGTQISDGGRDMFDNGNILSTNLDSPLFYFDNFILPSQAFGPSGQYLTRKVPGLFMLAADLNGVSSFNINGGLGADGFGKIDGSSLYINKKGVGYRLFVKRVYDAVDPSVNHLILLEDRLGLAQFFPKNTDLDNHTIQGLQRSRRLYYMLFGGENGRYMSDSVMLKMADSFLDIISPGPDYLQFSPDSATIAPGDSLKIQVQQTSFGLANGRYETDILFQSNDPQIPDTIIPAILDVNGAAALAVSADSLDFGAVAIRGNETAPWIISNTGCDTLWLQGLSSSNPAFNMPGLPAFLVPDQKDTLNVRFSPLLAQPYRDTATLETSADTVVVILKGSGTPSAWVESGSDTISLRFETCNDSVAVPLRIYNRGTGSLQFQSITPKDSIHILALTYGVDLNNEYQNTLQALRDEGLIFSITATLSTDPDSIRGLLPQADLLLLPESETGFPTAWSGLQVLVRDFVENGGNVVAMASLSAGSAPLFNLGIVQGFYRGPATGQARIDQRSDPLAKGLPAQFTIPQSTALLEITNGDYTPVAQAQVGQNQYDIAGYRRFGQGLIAILGMDMSQRSPEADRLLSNTVRWAGSSGALPWIPIGPTNQTVAPLDSIDILVPISGKGLYAGSYDGDVLFETNDPTMPLLRVPVKIEIDAEAVLSVSERCLDFGDVGQFRTSLDTLIIHNSGCDTLFIDTAFTRLDTIFSLLNEATPFLLPDEADSLFVEFSPKQVQAYSDSIRIISSLGDSVVCLNGNGLPVPRTSLRPDSISVLVTSCTDTTRVPMWLRNTGAAPTSFSTIAGRGNSSNEILIVEDVFPWGLDIAVLVAQRTGLRVTKVSSQNLVNEDLSLYGWVIALGDQPNSYYSAITNNQLQLEQFVQSGGLLQLHMATRGVNLRLPGGVTATDGNREINNDIVSQMHPIVSGLSSPLTGNLVSHGYFGNLPAGAQILTQTTQTALPTTINYTLGRGEVLATTMTWEFVHGQALLNSQPLLENAIQFIDDKVGSTPAWLKMVPNNGMLAAGDSVEIELQLVPSGLTSGIYSTVITVNTLDPLAPVQFVPLRMDLQGQPALGIQDTCLVFAPTFEQDSILDTLYIANPGCDTLLLTTQAIPASAFSVLTDTLHVPAGEEGIIVLKFSPGAAGLFRDTLHMTSNAGDSLICLQGEGLGKPIWQWVEDTIDVRLRICDDSVDVFAVLENVGNAPLDYRLPPDPQADSLEILVLINGVDTMTAAYQRMQQLLRQRYPRHRWNAQRITDPTLLQNALDTTTICLVPPLSSSGLIVWTNLGPTLQQYVSQGGSILWCGSSYLQSDPLFNTGLVSGSFGGKVGIGSQLDMLDSRHPITQGYPASITTLQGAFYLNTSPQQLQPLMRFSQGGTNYTALGYQHIGMGKLVWMGADMEMPDPLLDSSFVRAVLWGANYYPNTWWASPGQGQIAIGGRDTVRVRVFTAGIQAGDYIARLPVETNQPDSLVAPLFVRYELLNEPCAIISFDPLDVCDGLVRFTAEGRQPGDQQEWLFNGQDTASGLSTNYSFNTSGSQEVRLVTSLGAVSDTQTITVNIPTLLSAAFQYNGLLRAGEAISFVADSVRPAIFRWSFGDGNRAENATVGHVYARSGTYDVELVVTDSLGCMVDSTQSLKLDVGVANEPFLQDPKLEIYPNPFRDRLWLRWNTPERNAHVTLFDANGRRVHEEEMRGNKAELFVPGLAEGVYTLRLVMGEAVLVRKVIVRY
ncbi:MAG: PKD domain-containing protein [Bacteroidia bacterium]